MSSYSTSEVSQIQPLLQRADNSVDVCVTFLLLWMAAASDIKDNQALQNHLDKFHDSMEGTRDYADSILAIIRSDDISSFVAVCETLQRELNQEESWYLIDLAIGIAMLEGKITIAANHIFRCLLDLFGLSLDEFKKRFLRASNTIFPEPGDPSSLLWWEFDQDHSEPKDSAFYLNAHYDSINELQARNILGVGINADAAEIKKAYRRLAQHYHPDRYDSLDQQASEKAQHAFRLVVDAYEVLKS